MHICRPASQSSARLARAYTPARRTAALSDPNCSDALSNRSVNSFVASRSIAASARSCSRSANRCLR